MKPTAQQIQDWKAKYGIVYKVTTEDGREAYIKDPLSDLTIMKAAIIAGRGSRFDYVKCVLENCWLAGDESIKTDEAAISGMDKKIDLFTDLPKYKVAKIGEDFEITVGKKSIVVRKAMRADVQKAEQRNLDDQPFETAIHLLGKILVSGDLETIRLEDPKAYIGFLTAVDEVKNTAQVEVEKL